MTHARYMRAAAGGRGWGKTEVKTGVRVRRVKDYAILPRLPYPALLKVRW